MMNGKGSSIKKLLTLTLLTFCCLFGVSSVAFAATNSPYGYTYDDAASGKTVYKYYSYNSSKDTYVASREFYSIGSTVCRSNGTIITNLSMGSGSRYNGFASGGTFYVITSNGELISIDENYKVSTLISSGATSLTYDSDDLATVVKTSSGNKYLTDLSDAPETNDSTTVTTTTTKAKNRVDIYTNSADELVYEAYSNNKLKVTIVTSKNGKKVLNSTASVRLSDTLKGAKFMGLDSSYNVYLYETNGTLYRFTYGNWYSAEKISLGSTFKTFRTDDNGFVSEIVTTSSSYTLKQLTTSGKWKAKSTYTVSKSGYVTLYTKGSSKSNTLQLKSGKLYLNGTKVASNVTKYGFISSKKFAYIKNGKTYIATLTAPTKATKFCAKAKSFKKSSKGLITKVVLTTGKTKKI